MSERIPGIATSANLPNQNQAACVQASEEAVAVLSEQLRASQDELASVQGQIKQSEQRLTRAATLTDSLADEAVRWQAAEVELTQRLDTHIGDTLLAAASIAYLGPFPGAHRDTLLGEWAQICGRHELAASARFSLRDTLSLEMQARQWRLQVRTGPITCLSQRHTQQHLSGLRCLGSSSLQRSSCEGSDLRLESH